MLGLANKRSSILKWQMLKRIRGLHFTQRTWERLPTASTPHSTQITLNRTHCFGRAYTVFSSKLMNCAWILKVWERKKRNMSRLITAEVATCIQKNYVSRTVKSLTSLTKPTSPLLNLHAAFLFTMLQTLELPDYYVHNFQIIMCIKS